jgi:hypothetical protein
VIPHWSQGSTGIQAFPPAIPFPNVVYIIEDSQGSEPVGRILSRLDIRMRADEVAANNVEAPPVTLQDARKVGNVSQGAGHPRGVLSDALSAKVNPLHLEGGIRKQVDRYVNFHI